MADKRAFAVLDVGYFENPKTLDVLDASSIALSMHIASILYCSQHLTDGFVSTKAMQRKIGGLDSDTEILIDAGLWHYPGHDCDSCPPVPKGKVYVHDYLEHNRSSEGFKRTSERAKRAAEARWAGSPKTFNKHAEGNATSMPDASVVKMPNAMHRQTDRQKLNTCAPADADDAFETFWSLYPLKKGKAKAATAWKSASKKAPVEKIMSSLRLHLPEWKRRDRQFTPYAATWLNQERWNDEVEGQTDAGEIDPDAILGQDYWSSPAPPEGLTIQEEMEWKAERRAEHKAERVAEARQKLEANRG